MKLGGWWRLWLVISAGWLILLALTDGQRRLDAYLTYSGPSPATVIADLPDEQLGFFKVADTHENAGPSIPIAVTLTNPNGSDWEEIIHIVRGTRLSQEAAFVKAVEDSAKGNGQTLNPKNRKALIAEFRKQVPKLSDAALAYDDTRKRVELRERERRLSSLVGTLEPMLYFPLFLLATGLSIGWIRKGFKKQ